MEENEEKKTYEVEITEQLVRHIYRKGDVEKAAEEVRDKYYKEEIVLDSDDSIGYTIRCVKDEETGNWKEAPRTDERDDDVCAISIVETLRRTEWVEAEDEWEAVEQVEEMYDEEEIVLDSDDCVGTDFIRHMSVNDALKEAYNCPEAAKTNHTMLEIAGYRVIRYIMNEEDVDFETAQHSDRYEDLIHKEAGVLLARRGLMEAKPFSVIARPFTDNVDELREQGAELFTDCATVRSHGQDLWIDVDSVSTERQEAVMDWLENRCPHYSVREYRPAKATVLTLEDGLSLTGYITDKDTPLSEMMHRMHTYPFHEGLVSGGLMNGARLFKPDSPAAQQTDKTFLSFSDIRFHKAQDGASTLAVSFKDDYTPDKEYSVTVLPQVNGEGTVRLWKDGRCKDSVRIRPETLENIMNLAGTASAKEIKELLGNYLQRIYGDYIEDQREHEHEQNKGMKR